MTAHPKKFEGPPDSPAAPPSSEVEQLLRDLLSISPLWWAEHAWTALAEAGLLDADNLHFGNHVQRFRGDNAAKLVSRYSLTGHEAGIDVALAWRQVAEMGYDLFAESTHVASSVCDVLLATRDAGAAVPSLDVRLRGIGDLPEVSFETLVQHLAPADRARLATKLVAEPTLDDYRVAILDDGGFEIVHSALESIWRDLGVLRGPCKRCNRASWFIPYRPRGTTGRKPLLLEFCPTCVIAIKREQANERGKRKRSASAG